MPALIIQGSTALRKPQVQKPEFWRKKEGKKSQFVLQEDSLFINKPFSQVLLNISGFQVI